MQFTKFIFDFDGTLVDSMPTWKKKVTRILENEGIGYDDELIKTITPLGDIGTAKYFKDVLGVRSSIEEMILQMNSFAINEYKNNISLKAGIAEYLGFLKRNNCSLNILTASPREMLIPCLKRNGIYDMFDNIWSCTDFDKTKSDPSIYIDVASRLSIDPDRVVFFDDNICAIVAAKESGMHTIGVYDKSGEFFADEMIRTADLYIRSFLNYPTSNL